MENFTIKRSFYDSRPRSLIVNSDEIIYENTNLKSQPFTTIKKEDIAGLRHGIEFIKGLEFTIGRVYYIFIKTKNGKELKIDFKLFYGIELQKKHNLYCSILNALWNHYFYKMADNFVKEAKEGKTNKISGVTFDDTKIAFDYSEIILTDLEIKKYHHYFILYSKNNNHINKMLYYLKDGDAVILLYILKNLINKYE